VTDIVETYVKQELERDERHRKKGGTV